MAVQIPPNKAPKPRPAVIGDNSKLGEEAERVQLISIVSQLSRAEDAIEAAKVPLKAAQDGRKRIIGLGKDAGFSAKELGMRLEEMRMGTREMAEQEARERTHRRWLGIIEPEQAALIIGDKAPQETKDQAHWEGEGFKAGRRQMERKPAPECPERFVQAWLKQYDLGYKDTLTEVVPGKNRLAEQMAKDFAEDNPEVDVEKAARKLKKDAKFMAKSESAETEEVV